MLINIASHAILIVHCTNALSAGVVAPDLNDLAAVATEVLNKCRSQKADSQVKTILSGSDAYQI